MQIKNKEIAELLGINEVSVSRMKSNDPARFELIKIGAYCLKNNITPKDLRELAESKKEERDARAV